MVIFIATHMNCHGSCNYKHTKMLFLLCHLTFKRNLSFWQTDSLWNSSLVQKNGTKLH